MAENVATSLARAARLYPDHPYVIDGDARLSFREVEARVAGVDSGLSALGIDRGEVVGVLALNSHQHLEAWFAIPRGGKVLTDLNTRLAEAELAFILDDCSARALIIDDAHLEVGRALFARCGAIEHLIYAGRGACPAGLVDYEQLAASPRRPAAAVQTDTLAAICYTGGTTGLPKGVMLSHGNLAINARNIIIAFEFQRSDRYLHAGPMFHLADAAATFAITWIGGTHVMVPAFEPGLVLRTIAAEGVTTTTIVPTMISLLVHHPEVREHDLSSLRLVHYGAAPMPAELLRAAMDVITCDWAQAYGMTEAAPLVARCPPEVCARGVTGEEPFATRMQSAGVPAVGVEVEIRRPDGTVADPGEPGEICVRGPNVMLGYWERPEETAAALDDDGWYRSGDAAYADEDGYLYIVDRVKDMIISGGENVYSVEVEQALYTHPAVLEAAVFGVPSAQWGESVHAAVVLKDGMHATAEELVAHCREQIAAFKVPRGIDLHAEPLPKSGAGKLLKRELRAPFWAGQGRQVA